MCLVGILSAALEKDLVKLENPERTSEGVQRDGTTSVQDCKLNDSLGKPSSLAGRWRGEISIAQGWELMK